LVSDEAATQGLYRAAIGYLAVRKRSRHEIEVYLQRKGASAEEIVGIVGRLEEAALINDLDFARSWVADRQALRPRSRLALRHELAARGITRDISDQVIRDISQSDEVSSIVKIIATWRRAHPQRTDTQLQEYLSRKGYEFKVIREAMGALLAWPEGETPTDDMR
jgi:regulatory protein